MIEETKIVQDTRKIRCLISKQFNDDIDKYLDYLKSQKSTLHNHEKHTQKLPSYKKVAQQNV